MRRLTNATVVVLVLLVGGVVMLLPQLSRNLGPATSVSDWIGRQILSVVNRYVVPEISFERLTYSPPGRVDLIDTVFTAPDGTRVLQLQGLSLELTEVPRLGRPILVERVTVERGAINLIRDPASGALRGLWPLVKSPGSADRGAAGAAAASEPETLDLRLSDVLRLRKVAFEDIAIRYDPGDGKPAMELAGITTELNIAPPPAPPEADASASPDGNDPRTDAGWYSIDFAFERPGLLALRVKGRVNLDTLLVEVHEGSLSATLNEAARSNLPPDVQVLLVEHEISGELSATFSGSVPLADWIAGSAEVEVELRDLAAAAGAFRVRMSELLVSARLADRRIEAPLVKGVLLGGTFEMKGRATPGGKGLPASLSWKLEDIDLRAVLRSAQTSTKAPPVAGKLSSSGAVDADLAALPASLRGAGDVRIREGELLWIPGVTKLAEVAHIGLDFANVDLRDRGEAAFRLDEKGVEVTRSELVSTFIAARGEGRIGYDGALDLRVNAGPMEKLKSVLGDIAVLGELSGHFSKLTDRLMAYRVRGTVAAPQVEVRVLGR